jgi:hypothetical protein
MPFWFSFRCLTCRAPTGYRLAVRIVLFAFVWLRVGGWTTPVTLAGIAWYTYRRAREERWAAYIRNECALYIEEVLSVA